MKTSTPRLRSVTFKDGRAPLRVIRPGLNRDVAEEFREDTEKMFREWGGSMAGYAIVIWDKTATDGNASWFVGDNPSIHTVLVPAFVHDFLLRRMTINKTMRELESAPAGPAA